MKYQNQIVSQNISYRKPVSGLHFPTYYVYKSVNTLVLIIHGNAKLIRYVRVIQIKLLSARYKIKVKEIHRLKLKLEPQNKLSCCYVHKVHPQIINNL